LNHDLIFPPKLLITNGKKAAAATMAGMIIAQELDRIYILSPLNNAPDISPGRSLSFIYYSVERARP
jgi:hypothetical protein